MKSISLDSPEQNSTGMDHTDRISGANGLRHKNMSVPKIMASVAADCQSAADSQPKNFGIGIGNRRYGAWANVVRSRMAAQAAQVPPRRPPNSMEFGVAAAASAPPSYNQCNFHFDVIRLLIMNLYMCCATLSHVVTQPIIH